jgi:nucleoside-diphosphate-sugar epimerase
MIKNLKVLVTGDQGFVGRETVKYFLDKGIEVIGFDLMGAGAGTDIRNIDDIRNILQLHKERGGIDRILHLAAIARFAEADSDPKLAFETNVIGTRNVAVAAAEFGIPVVYASTGSVYMPITEEPPITEEFPVSGNSNYACTKLLGELYIKQYASTWIILRYSHLYGKDKRYHGLIGGFLKKIETFMSPVLYGGQQSNDFCYVKDIARANYKACTTTPDNWRQIYNIGTGEELTAEEAGKIICDKAGYKGDIDIKVGRTVDPLRFVFNVDKAKNMLEFEAEYTFETGLDNMFGLIKLQEDLDETDEKIDEALGTGPKE